MGLVYIYAGEDIPSVDDSEEIAAILATIDGNKNDFEWVSNNWNGLLKESWAVLPQLLTINLQDTYDKGK